MLVSPSQPRASAASQSRVNFPRPPLDPSHPSDVRHHGDARATPSTSAYGLFASPALSASLDADGRICSSSTAPTSSILLSSLRSTPRVGAQHRLLPYPTSPATSPRRSRDARHPDICGKIFKDLKAHMLTTPERAAWKCSIVMRVSRQGPPRMTGNRHVTPTHYKGTMVCASGFAPAPALRGGGRSNRADVFKRRPTAVHGGATPEQPLQDHYRSWRQHQPSSSSPTP